MSDQPKPVDVSQANEIARCESLPVTTRNKCYEPIIAKMNASSRGPISGWVYIVIMLLVGVGSLIAAIIALKKRT